MSVDLYSYDKAYADRVAKDHAIAKVQEATSFFGGFFPSRSFEW